MLVLLSFFPRAQAAGRQSAQVGHFFGAVGLLLGPASFRIGRRKWEFGLLNSKVIGVNKIMNVSKNLYGALGLGFYGGNRPGVFAGVGYEFMDYKWINLRFEANGMVSYKNNSYAELLLGASLNI
jgi:hypothetical protein